MGQRILKALGHIRKRSEHRVSARAAAKKRKPKRLRGEEFLKVYDSLWQEGPLVKYQNPDSWVKPADRS